jgi:hypothetical protein
MTVEEADRVRCGALLAEWARQAAFGELTDAGLFEVRARIRTGEFDIRPEARAVLVQVVAAIMAGRGLTTWHVPGEALPEVPDDASEITGAP